jgi:hypothetical protein
VADKRADVHLKTRLGLTGVEHNPETKSGVAVARVEGKSPR